MKKDIDFPPVENVYLAITRQKIDLDKDFIWKVYLINDNDSALDNVLVSSKGYGQKDGEKQRTSILRHLIERVEARDTAQIELIDQSVFHLNNEYWVSYYIDGQVYDKKFIFVQESIIEDNLVYIPQLELNGILHK